MKLLIIGNAGCGKTYLAKKLAKKKKIPIYHIDHLWFKPGGYSSEFERTPTERNSMIKKIMAKKITSLKAPQALRLNSLQKRHSSNVCLVSNESMCGVNQD